MTPSPRGPLPPDDGQLESYLDGLLRGEALAAFEARLASDPVLRDQVEQQLRINESLRRVFEVPPAAASAPTPRDAAHTRGEKDATPGAEPPETAEVDHRIREALRKHFAVPAESSWSPPAGPADSAAPPSRARPRLLAARLRQRPWMAAAALIILTVVVAAYIAIGSDEPGDPRPILELSAAYVEALDPGFTPEHPWTGPDAFTAELDRQFGVNVRMEDPAPPDTLADAPQPPLLMQGWSRTTVPVMSPDTLALYARRGPEPVVVIIDRESADRELPMARGTRTIKHRRVLNGLVMYEVGTSETPVIINHFRAP